MRMRSGRRAILGTRKAVIGALATAILVAGSGTSHAAEGATGFYLLGFKGPGAGILPPPGVFVENDFYFYDGSASASRPIPIGGNIVANLDVQLYADFVTLLVIAPWEIAGGNLGFMAALPFGGPNISASGSVMVGGRGPFTRSVSDSIFTVGDPILGTMLGWHSGKFHWNVVASVNIPIGDYHKGELANIALHRWSFDFTAAATWLDPQSGWDLSAAVGFTTNLKNTATNYRTGNELHIEVAASKYLSKDFSVGLVGYHYQQLTGDSGPGAILGPFKGRVSALGGMLSYNFVTGKTPVSTRVTIFREFNVKNRLTGSAVFLTASMPLAVFGQDGE